MRYSLLTALFLSLVVFSAKAQLKADFTMDKAGGCSPFSVSFTNTTTGASAAATYEWNFGNGNTSVLKNAAAVYHEEKNYTVTLTVKDGSQTSKQTKTIAVYKKPTVAFTFSPNNGCIPLTVNFTSSSQAGDGTLTAYHWDFGDGSTQESPGARISHTYNFQQTASVSLTAVNSHGCSNTLTKNDIIKVNPALQASFSADKTMLCDLPGTVNFSNTSTGAGTLAYEWDFGDGTTSKDKSPSHSYTKKGIYTVKLTVKSSEGCTNSSVRNDYINAGNFNSDIQVPSLICQGTSVTFNSTASTTPSQTRWIVDGNTYYYYTSMYYTFNTPGQHTVELVNTFNGCEQKVTKKVDVKPMPAVSGFIADIKDQCGAPAKVEFKDTTTGAVSWQWNFNYSWDNSVVHSTVKNPTYTYQSDNWYYARLTVKNADGCSASTMKQIGISKPQVGIHLDDNSRNEACSQLTVKMVVRSTEDIKTYSWNFGDGGTSTEASPTHTYTRPGSYTISLTYKTDKGCTGTVTYYGTIRVWEKPKADFSVQPEVCGNTPVLFTNKTTGYVINYVWDFGDNNGYGWETNPTHKYQAEGQYTVRLIANNWICNDTVTKTAIIKVKPPFAKIERVANTCSGTRGLVTFTDGSRQANSWHWDFGDGATSSYTTAQPTIEHTYTKTGSYKAVLTVTNGACTVKDSTTVYVLLKQKPVLSFDKPEACINQYNTFQIKGLENNPYQVYNYYSYYEYAKWEDADGTAVNGSYYNQDYWIKDVKGNINFYQPKDDQVRAIIRSAYFGCADTTNYVPLTINGVIPGFEVVTDNRCFKLPVVLEDTSQTTGDNTIAKWEWNFGDGTTKTNTTGGTVNHTYANPGSYYVSLKVTDKNGCSSSTPYYGGFVRVGGPKAAFYIPGGNTVQLNTNVYFYNNTNTAYTNNVTYKWDFGNGITSTEYSPSHTYTESGKYEVVLIAENRQTGCSDTARQTITVKNFNTAFTFTTAFIGNYSTCPPVRANFTNTSTNYTKLIWDFGDGFTLENQHSPSHVYENAGKYVVTLTVYGYNGLTGFYEDTVFVAGPTATIEANDLDGCIGTEVKLHAPEHTDTKSYVWDFGDGYVVNVADSFAAHTYLSPGSYTPSLILKDDKGCSSVISLSDKVTIYPDAVITITPSSPFVCKEDGVQLQASGAETYEWSPETGLSSVSSASPIALPPDATTYTIKGTDANGCKGSTTITVEVPKPFTMSVSPDAEICKGSNANLKAEGASTYQWINTTMGLNETQIANPVASPENTIQYTVVGYDQYKCYSDTAQVNVIVRPSPSVNAGDDKEVIYGSENVLNITNSNDVVRWSWAPAGFLSCTNCPAPVSKPYKTMEYVVEVFNGYHCSAKDTVILKGLCAGNKIFIPSAFTPNRDGLNDRFTVNGMGISIVKSLRIYNRWGEIVFERKNFYPNDRNAGWDGKYGGIDQPAEAYVYFAEMQCNAGEKIVRKGTVTIVR